MPDGTPRRWRGSTSCSASRPSAETAARIRDARNDDEVTDSARRVDARPSSARPRRRARALLRGPPARHADPGARFVPLDSRNHVLLARDPAWPAFRREVRRLPRRRRADRRGRRLPDLSAASSTCCELVAAGSSNDEIAARLVISVRTVERHCRTSTRSCASRERPRGGRARPRAACTPPPRSARSWVVAPMAARAPPP